MSDPSSNPDHITALKKQENLVDNPIGYYTDISTLGTAGDRIIAKQNNTIIVLLLDLLDRMRGTASSSSSGPPPVSSQDINNLISQFREKGKVTSVKKMAPLAVWKKKEDK